MKKITQTKKWAANNVVYVYLSLRIRGVCGRRCYCVDFYTHKKMHRPGLF